MLLAHYSYPLVVVPMTLLTFRAPGSSFPPVLPMTGAYWCGFFLSLAVKMTVKRGDYLQCLQMLSRASVIPCCFGALLWKDPSEKDQCWELNQWL